MSRLEELLNDLLDGETTNIVPQSRIEEYLLKCIEGSGSEGAPLPQSRVDALLYALAEKLAGGGSSGGETTENKLAQVVDGSITEITSSDLEGATQIRDYAFYYFYSLTNIEIPDTVTNIGTYSFYNCPNLKNVVLSNTLETIGNNAFENCSLLEDIVLPNSIVSVGKSAFHNCKTITSIVVPSQLTTLPSGFVESCTSLTNITLHENITTLGNSAIRGCASLQSILIPDSVKTIESMCFWQSTSLANVIVGSGVTNIGSNVFGNNSTMVLTTFVLKPTTPPTIQSSTFGSTPYIEKIIVPKGTLSAYQSATNWATYADKMEEATE